MKILRNIILAMAISLFGLGLLGAGNASALSPILITASASKDAACAGLDQIDSTQSCGTNGSGVTNIVASVVKIISFVTGIAAIIMVLVAGFKYITSNGDAGKVGSAKTTIIYALVGVAIAAIAQLLVHFAVNTATDSTGASCTVSGKTSLAASNPNCK